MKPFAHLMEQALAAAVEPGEQIDPTATAHEADDVQAAQPPGEAESPDRVWTDWLNRVAMEVRMAAATGSRPPPNLVWLLRWIIATLSSWTAATDPFRRRLDRALTAVSFFGPEEAYWRALPSRIGENPDLLSELTRYLQSLRVD